MEFGELEDNLDGFRLVISAQAAMLLALEDSVAALEDQVRTDRILFSIQALVKPFLLWQQYNCAVLPVIGAMLV